MIGQSSKWSTHILELELELFLNPSSTSRNISPLLYDLGQIQLPGSSLTAEELIPRSLGQGW